ncbi:MAG: tryptophan synthase subunit alpha [Candidatus Poribacteria bacterium]|nr:tryptophan synthase subunit alpha [Candidatus Poribacteria bacterium]
MNRIEAKFKELGARGESAFMPYICAGDPTPEISRKLVLTLEAAGADLIELGVPFSDPIADGPTVQKASERALANQISLQQIIDLVRGLRAETQLPIALMTYYNPIFRMGESKFCKTASEAGVDGVIIPDLPPEEADTLLQIATAHNLATIFLVAPTSPPERLRRIASVSTGFIYCVSVTGVTGARTSLSAEIQPMVTELRKYTEKPLCVGFGVSTRAQADTVAQLADGVIVGSAIVNVIEAHLNDEVAILSGVKEFAAELAHGVKQRH